jgi:hypothetical protein
VVAAAEVAIATEGTALGTVQAAYKQCRTRRGGSSVGGGRSMSMHSNEGGIARDGESCGQHGEWPLSYVRPGTCLEM